MYAASFVQLHINHLPNSFHLSLSTLMRLNVDFASRKIHWILVDFIWLRLNKLLYSLANNVRGLRESGLKSGLKFQKLQHKIVGMFLHISTWKVVETLDYILICLLRFLDFLFYYKAG